MEGNLWFGDGTGDSSATIPILGLRNANRDIRLQLLGDGQLRLYNERTSVSKKYNPFSLDADETIRIGASSRNPHIYIGGKDVMRTVAYANSGTEIIL